MRGHVISQRITSLSCSTEQPVRRPAGVLRARRALLLSCVVAGLTATGAAFAADGPAVKPAATEQAAQAPQQQKTEPLKTEPQKADAKAEAQKTESQKAEPETVGRPAEAQAPAPKVVVPSTEPAKPVAAERKPDTNKAETKTASRDTKDGKNLTVPQRMLPPDVAQMIGRKIWLNEAGGRRDAITSWNAGEEFASLGIGHFIWYPTTAKPPYEEGFPGLVAFLRKGKTPLPAWLDKNPIPACPWTSRADFKRNFNSPQMKQLRQFLLDTMAEQTQFLVARAQGAMDKILANTPDGAEREHIVAQYSRVVRASEDLYPLIDYINFKGEGTNPSETAVDKETGQRQGWGLKQVLLKMNGTTTEPKAVLAEYSDAVQVVLQQRVRNLPSNRVWEAGWLRRAETYRRPIAQLDQAPERAPRKSSRYRADNSAF
ncbi:conserved exported protein of unknown function [Bradyrhizobium sp. ORS 285]|uniref:hypothetical protein n=1 Tax=Bradyrhizobium sp. ORS 285 TaxID=115808 RepID=UPI00024084D9|nr:hypothetical protein [Bradyrhizobium sp. ORS 285]CCD89145.1 conserved exported hypothetical protein [Bradyrhizobium sp. ORS 285]SMX55972.1 conserved exported protein of unknown function [Bradyrhizobium sp. ORS 285]